MKFEFKVICYCLAPMVVAMSLSLPTVAQEKTALQKERTAKMKILARSMFQLKNALNAASMKAPATAIAATSRKLANMWPEGSGGSSTRAKSEIWNGFERFLIFRTFPRSELSMSCFGAKRVLLWQTPKQGMFSMSCFDVLFWNKQDIAKTGHVFHVLF